MANNEPRSPKGAGRAGVMTARPASGILIIDANGRLASCTEGAAALLGLNSADVGEGLFDNLPAPVVKIIRRTMSSGKSVAGAQCEVNVAGAGTRILEVSATPLSSARKGVAVALTDLTKFARAEQSLRQMNRLAALGTLSASLAHDIRNALVAGKTFFDLLLEKHQDAELAGTVRRELERIDVAVSQMLGLAGAGKGAFSAIRVHQLLDHSLRLVHRQFAAKSNALHRSFCASTDMVQGDGVQLEQAFMNLLLNAADATGPNGSLTVATELLIAPSSPNPRRRALASPQLRITFQDTGMGIAEEHLGHMFEPFFTTKDGGTGLGLAITRRIIQEHGGSIGVVSQPKKGTTFQILLPALA